jgi:PKD repeat protein
VDPSVDPSVAPSVDPSCSLPSAGFTYTTLDGNGSPSGNKSPVIMTVIDTSTSSPSCPITSWIWHWGDGGPDWIGQTPPPHVFTNPGPAANKSFEVSLTVANCVVACDQTSGVVIITVKK